MDDLINPLADAYAAQFSFEESDLLKEIEKFTYAHHAQPHMLSGKVQGNILATLSALLQPETILEIGTFTGYSALCLAAGLSPNGCLHTIEINEDDAAIAQNYFNRSHVADKIKLHIGNAKTIIKSLDYQWDMVFIDADKTGYIEYYELILPSVRKNGVIIADNVLFHGQVLNQKISGKNAIAIHAFNQHVKSDTRVAQVLLTVRDGLLIIRKR
jgi:caffeoyl-CoA O-methyltransferase